MKKLRTIEQAHEELKRIDPGTAISRNFIREAVLGGDLPFLKVKSKRLIDMNDLMEYIEGEMKDMKAVQNG